MRNEDKKIGISQKAIVSRDDGKILAIRRSDTHPLRPKGWDIPGGDLEFGEDAKEGMRREIAEETGLEVSDLKVVDVISWPNDRGEFWITICYLAKSEGDAVKLSWEHDDFKWVMPEEFRQLDALPRIKQFVEFFKSQK
jgi:ADP-ribose pyrophosphatase YjhB (NUDIX family)